jgi:hypothetical protein
MSCKLLATILIVGASMLSLLLEVRLAYACTCAPFSLERVFRESDAILVGEILGEVQRPHVDEFGDRYIEHDFLVRVVSNYKGADAPEVQIYTSIRSLDADRHEVCPTVGFAVGETYLIYAYHYDGKLRASLHICSHSQLLSEAGRDIKALEEIKVNGQLPGGMPKTGHEGAALLLVTSLSLLSILAGLSLCYRRGSRT